jgi:hypothetical protein
VRNNTLQADYYTQTQSWHEQRQFVYNAVDSIRKSIPALAAAIDAEFQTLADIRTPDTSGYTSVPTATNTAGAGAPRGGSALALTCGSATIGFNPKTGAIVQLRSGASGASQEWANATNPIGQYLCESLTFATTLQFRLDPGKILQTPCLSPPPAPTRTLR